MEHPAKILKRNGLLSKKGLGQNFLVDTHSLFGAENYFQTNQKILEIGPGLGAVTDYFEKNGFSIWACEKDTALCSYLKEQRGKTLKVWEGDFLSVHPNVWEEKHISYCIGNLPFYITTEVIVHVINNMPFIEKCLWGVQLEFAQRILSNKSSSLSVFMKICGEVLPHKRIKKNSFYPVPKVDAFWILWERKPRVKNIALFEELLRASFWGKRKRLSNALQRNPFFDTENKVHRNWLNKLEGIREENIDSLLQKRADEMGWKDYLLLFNWLNDDELASSQEPYSA